MSDRIVAGDPCPQCGGAPRVNADEELTIGHLTQPWVRWHRAVCSCGWRGIATTGTAPDSELPPPVPVVAPERPSVESLIAEAMKRPAPEGVVIEVVGCAE